MAALLLPLLLLQPAVLVAAPADPADSSAPAAAVHKCCPAAQAMLGPPVKRCGPAPAAAQPSVQALQLSLALALSGLGLRLEPAAPPPAPPRPACPCDRYLLPDGEFAVLPNGSLLQLGPRANVSLARGGFCLDAFVGTQSPAAGHALVCFATCPGPGPLPLVDRCKYWGMLASAAFLAATLAVYALVPRLRNLHGCALMCHAAALLSGYLLVPALGLRGVVAGRACTASAFIIYFSFLASFFWLNVMCLDIWWTFSGYRPMRGSVKEREHKKFIIYSLYCWGGPLIMLTICMIMDLHPGIPDTFKKPGFGKMKCWFETDAANLLYFNGPIAVLIVCNIILFICTAFKIQKLKQETKILKKQDSRRHNEEEENNTQRFVLYLKLFLVMGVNWSMEVISFAVGGQDWWWYVTDIANTLQGVLIFVIFVWKDRIWRLLKERFCPQPVASTVSSGNTSTHTANTRVSSSRASIKRAESEKVQMKHLVPSPSVRSDDSDIA